MKQTPGLNVEVVNGARGEFTVLVDGREVIRKGEGLPAVEEVATAVTSTAAARPGG